MLVYRGILNPVLTVIFRMNKDLPCAGFEVGKYCSIKMYYLSQGNCVLNFLFFLFYFFVFIHNGACLTTFNINKTHLFYF